MASIIITFVEKTANRNLNPPATGSSVAAWPVSGFVQIPADGTYPTTQSPAATGATAANGSVTLTGLTGAALYYVSIVDAGGMPHWTQPLVAGSGAANKLTYVPSPFTPPPAPATLANDILYVNASSSTLAAGSFNNYGNLNPAQTMASGAVVVDAADTTALSFTKTGLYIATMYQAVQQGSGVTYVNAGLGKPYPADTLLTTPASASVPNLSLPYTNGNGYQGLLSWVFQVVTPGIAHPWAAPIGGGANSSGQLYLTIVKLG